MTAQKPAETAAPKGAGRGHSRTETVEKETPVEVVLDQINRVREDVARREEELKVARRQLQKLEDARKLLESN